MLKGIKRFLKAMTIVKVLEKYENRNYEQEQLENEEEARKYEQFYREQHLLNLIDKARSGQGLTLDEFEEIELDCDLCDYTESMGKDEFDYGCNKWKLFLVDGEEIEVSVI